MLFTTGDVVQWHADKSCGFLVQQDAGSRRVAGEMRPPREKSAPTELQGTVPTWRICEWLSRTEMLCVMVTVFMDNYGSARANTCMQSGLLEGVYF